jgi:hypothetical protein
LLEKPFSPQRPVHNPVQQVSINLWANWFHKIAGKTVTRVRVYVQNADARIEPQRGSSQAGFRFEYRIEVIQDRIGRIDREPR